jgi:hypothetical protein
MIIKTTIWLLAILFFCSCEKDQSPEDGIEELIPGRKIYVVGSSYNSSGHMTACYWVDGVRYELPGGAWATDITVFNGDVYTSGTSESFNACYWINQVRYELPGSGGEAEAIAVDNDNVYVAGWYDNGSCFWQNGQKIDLTINRDSQAFAIGVRNNGSVYIGGYYMNNDHYIIPCFWKDGNNRTNLTVPNGGDGEVYDIAFMDGNMRYYGGYVLKTSNFAGYTPTAAYWRHTTRTNLPLGGSTMDIYGAIGNAITINGEDVYVAGYRDWFGDTGQEGPSGGYTPQYWKNGDIYDLEEGMRTDFGTGAAYDIKIVEGDIVVVGVAPRDTINNISLESACIWLNGELKYLLDQDNMPEDLDDWMVSTAKGLYIE